MRPHFAPKAPVKRDITENKQEVPKVKEEKKSFRPNNKGGRGPGGPNAGRGGPPRRFNEPVGAAFFSASSATSSTTTSASSIFIGSSSSSAQAKIKPDPTASRPNEDLLTTIGDYKIKDGDYMELQEDDSHRLYDTDDSDASEPEIGGNKIMIARTGEVIETWPPSADYDQLQPVSVPIGPKSIHMRRILANQPILANPKNEEEMLNEESNSLFLVQLPSDLNFNSIIKKQELKKIEQPTSQVIQEIKELENIIEPLENGKIGKIQLLKSGNIRIVTHCGKKYDVTSGISSSILQYLSNITIKRDESIELNKNTVDENGIDTAKSGNYHILGKVTKKLIVSPIEDQLIH